MQLSAKKQWTVKVEDCPRCGQTHENALFQPLDNPQDRNDIYWYCPEAVQPVLASTEDLETASPAPTPGFTPSDLGGMA